MLGTASLALRVSVRASYATAGATFTGPVSEDGTRHYRGSTSWLRGKSSRLCNLNNCKNRGVV